jgi:hypothetical protein
MRLLLSFVALLVVVVLSSGSQARALQPATLKKADLGHRFLLQVSYERDGTRRDFNTSRSRIVAFRRDGDVLQMLDATHDAGTASPEILAKIPIRLETDSSLVLDLNVAFDSVSTEEDRTGEDYYGRIETHEGSEIRLFEREAVSVTIHGATLVFDQAARTDDNQPILVHYYLSRYEPPSDFRPFEMKNLRRFGFYETYPQMQSGRWVLYAMKFDEHQPIVFALSSTIPEYRRAAVRDGVLYWNRALGRDMVRVVDAPPGVRAPHSEYNVVQWTTSGEFASTSYIQSDPLTGQILHAHVFVLPETMMDGDLEDQNDHLRYIVAHEIGHALGLRHNFAPGKASTVMGYFRVPQILKIGKDIRSGAPALPFDTAVVQHVYLGAPLDLSMLPAFCTDYQRGCSPFFAKPKESEGIRGGPSSHRGGSAN